MTALPKRLLTPAEYLAREETAAFKSEFYRGETFAMAGATIPHNTVFGNVYLSVGTQLADKGCRAFASDQRVLVQATGLYTYPDITIVCGPPEVDPLSPETITNPVVIFEILSPSTASYDRGEKFRQYQQIPTLQEYVLVAQDGPWVVRLVRQEGNWLLTSFDGLDTEFALTTLPVRIPLAKIYHEVKFPPPTLKPRTLSES
jgi:Uma2 family endonuclease